jgi:hypothetical protein
MTGARGPVAVYVQAMTYDDHTHDTRGASTVRAAAGDRLVRRSRRPGEADRTALILEVLGPKGAPPYRIQWEDREHPSLLFPGSEAVIIPAERPTATARAV